MKKEGDEHRNCKKISEEENRKFKNKGINRKVLILTDIPGCTLRILPPTIMDELSLILVNAIPSTSAFHSL